MLKHDLDTEYHKVKAVSNSMIKEYKDQPYMAGLRYWSDIDLTEPKKGAYIEGDAIHAKYLDPERFEREFVVKPEGMNFSTNQGKVWKLEHSGKHVLTNRLVLQHQYDILKNSPINHLIEKCEVEASLYFERDKIPCKVRFDSICPEIGFIGDLKKTAATSAKEFFVQCLQLHYPMQAAWYTLAAEQAFDRGFDFYFIGITSSLPVKMFYFRLPDDVFSKGVRIVDSLFGEIKRSIENNVWPLRESEFDTGAFKPWELGEYGI